MLNFDGSHLLTMLSRHCKQVLIHIKQEPAPRVSYPEKQQSQPGKSSSCFNNTAWAAASLAIGTRKGEQDT